MMNDPTVVAETPVVIECGDWGERIAVGEPPHQHVSRGAVPAMGLNGSRPPISDLLVGRCAAS